VSANCRQTRRRTQTNHRIVRSRDAPNFAVPS
jgi:hypothetical protein